MGLPEFESGSTGLEPVMQPLHHNPKKRSDCPDLHWDNTGLQPDALLLCYSQLRDAKAEI